MPYLMFAAAVLAVMLVVERLAPHGKGSHPAVLACIVAVFATTGTLATDVDFLLFALVTFLLVVAASALVIRRPLRTVEGVTLTLALALAADVVF